MDAVRTPDDCFANLPDYPWQPHYADDLPGFEGLRMAWLDEGPRDAEHTFLCLHGEPTWSFLYRKMIPIFLEAGGRVVAPDWFGFGRSDKPVDDSAYSFDFHRDSLLALVRRLDLQRVTLVCQDWGGLLGLTLPVDEPDRLARLIVMNTTLATGAAPPDGFVMWRDFMRRIPDPTVSRLMRRSAPALTLEELAAYDAPFPDPRYKAGVRTFPDLVPVTREMPGAAVSRQAVQWLRESWTGPSFMAIGMQDFVFGPAEMQALHAVIPGCPPPLELADEGPFVQESGDEVARAALAYFGGS